MGLRIRWLTGLAGLVLALHLAACQSGADPGVTPSPVVTPSAAAPSPPESELERQMRLDKEAATNAYLRSHREVARLAMAGGATKPTQVLLDTMAGDYLKLHVEGLKDMYRQGLRIDRPPLVRVKQVPGARANEIDLIACEDGSKIRFLDRRGKEVPIKDRAPFAVHTLIAKRIDGVWKIEDGHSDPVLKFAKDGPCAA